MWRLAVAIILFLISLLTVCKAPTHFFWLVAIAITEFPYISILISAVFFICCCYAPNYKLVLLCISGVSMFFYLLPIIQVYNRGQHLAEDLQRNFPFNEKAGQLKKPFSVIKLFSGIGVTDIPFKTLTYKQLPDTTLTLDLYPAQQKTKAPCVIMIHGGSWQSGDSKQFIGFNRYLAQNGYNVAAINYRLAPKYRSPAPVEDTKDALHYLIQHAEALNIDSSNFVLMGRSAGAQIALVAAYTFHDPKIKGVISYYGPADMVWGAHLKSNKLVLNTDKVFTDYLGGLIGQIPAKYHEASAYDFADQNSPPTLLVHGPHDALVSYGHSLRLSKKLEDHHVPNYFLNLPWATHGCDYNINGPSGQITTFAAERFINSVTSR